MFLDDQGGYGLHYNFVCKNDKNLTMISIQNSHDENAFMVELFWSNDGTKFENSLTDVWVENNEDVLKKNCNESGNSLRIRLSTFYAREFGSWWAIDPTGKIIESIEKYGFITSDAYFQFYSEDSFLSDETDLSEEEMTKYIDPLIHNVIEVLKKYGMVLFECLNNKA
jgi:hypothetical protein